MINKLIQRNIPLNRILLIFILSFYIVIGHIFLPMFGKRDFFFLFRWDLYTFMPPNFVHDLTWDQGNTFLLKDHRKKIKKLYIFRYLVITKNLNRIRKDYKDSLLKLCQCKSIHFVSLKGFLMDHLIYKKSLEIVESTEL